MLRPVSTPEANELLLRGSLALAQVEHNGIRIDTDYVSRTRAEITNRCKDLHHTLYTSDIGRLWRRKFGTKTNLGSDDQLAEVLFNDCGFEPTKFTEKGRPATDKASLEALKDPFCVMYTEWSELQKANGTFLAGIERETVNGFLHPVFSLHMVTTYRSSSEAPNFQNFPVRSGMMGRLVRSAFIPRKPNWRLVEIDYSGIEVRIAACYHKDPTMLEYIHDPTKDMHRDMAAEIYLCKQSQVTKMARYVAKNRYVFPEFYGSYWEQVATDLWNAIGLYGLTVQKDAETEVPMDKWLRKKGISSAQEFAEHIKRVEENFWGERFSVYDNWRKRWFKEYLINGGYRTLTGFYIYGPYKRNDVINHPVQGSAFHCVLWSLIEIQAELRRKKMKAKVVGQIHDSIVGDVPDSEFEDYLSISTRIMKKRIRKHWDWIIVPLDVEAEAGGCGESWYEKKKVELN